MNIKQLAGAAAITTSVGLSAFTLGVGVFHATLSDPPPPCPTCQPDPGGPGSDPPTTPGIKVPGPGGTTRMEPPTGGGPKSGGRAVQPHGFSPPLRSDS
ncbi:MAG: hypothetical protein QOE48_3395 [Mycobacterium sp.]|jgi:hypothetical protein|nr:hypothetical protein [Mycobacterium sp.]MDT5307717.1 hypothetical protein [Mycobacterium sp.]